MYNVVSKNYIDYIHSCMKEVKHMAATIVENVLLLWYEFFSFIYFIFFHKFHFMKKEIS